MGVARGRGELVQVGCTEAATSKNRWLASAFREPWTSGVEQARPPRRAARSWVTPGYRLASRFELR
jgi:hypothetical protein